MIFEIILYLLLLASAILKAFAVSVVEYQEYISYVITVISLYFIFKYAIRLAKDKLISYCLIYILLICISWFIHLFSFETDEFYIQLNAFLFPNLLISSYIFFLKYPQYFKYFKIIGIPLIIAAFWNVQRLSAFANEWTTTVTLQSNSGNLLVGLIPFCLLYKNRFIRYILWAIIFIGVCLSIKRSAFVIFFLCFIFANIVGNEFLKKRKVLVVISLCLFVIAFLIVAPNIEIFSNLLERMNEVDEDHGSGRDALFLTSLKMCGDSNFIEMFFGNGYLSASKDLEFYKFHVSSTHNDFTEILYDGGLFSLICFVLILKCLYNKTKFIFKSSYSDINYSTITACCLITIFIANLLICSYVHFWYYLPLFCIYGGAIACAYKVRK